MTATATKAPKVRETLTLRDTSDLLLLVDAWIEQHIDELELNGGALPDDLAALLDEVQGSRETKGEAIVFKLDQYSGNAASAKATKDRAARREKVWGNTIAALKAYAVREIERAGGEKIKAASATLRLQASPVSTEVRFDNEQLLAFADANAGPLARFITVTRVATVDKKTLAVAYELRLAELNAEVEAFTFDDLAPDIIEMCGPEDPTGFDRRVDALERMRTDYVANRLASEFPGVSCTRGLHLRID